MGIGPKAKTRDHERPMGKRAQGHQYTRTVETVLKDLF